MNRLDQLHYLPVFLKPVKGRVLVFNPTFSSTWDENSAFLQQLKLKPLVRPYLNNFYFTELNNKFTPPPTVMNYEQSLLSFCLQSISLPEKMTESEYFALMHNNYLSVTEKFLSRHVCGHVASSRHVLLKNIQIKGVGRTASTQQLSHPNMNGFIQTGEAVRGYFNGQLLNISLPFGAVNVQAVLCVPDEKLHSSLIVRDALSHRLAQIEPVFLSAADKQFLKNEVDQYFPQLSTLEILDQILEQHLCLWAMGVEHPMTVDNLALAGFPMDEEDMRPAHDMTGLSLDFNVSFKDSSTEIITDWKDLKNLEFTVYSGINHRLTNLLKWYDESLTWLKDESSHLQEASQRKIPLMRKVFNRFYQSQDVETFLTYFQKFEANNSLSEIEAFNLFQELDGINCQFSFTDMQVQFRFSMLRVRFNMRAKQDVRGLFNQHPRTPTEKIVKGMGRFEMQDDSYDSESAFNNSSQLHMLVNRQAFSLAETMTLNETSALDFLSKQAGGFEMVSLTIFTLNGFETILVSNWIKALSQNHELILVDMTVRFQQKDFVLPTLKVPLRFK